MSFYVANVDYIVRCGIIRCAFTISWQCMCSESMITCATTTQLLSYCHSLVRRIWAHVKSCRLGLCTLESSVIRKRVQQKPYDNLWPVPNPTGLWLMANPVVSRFQCHFDLAYNTSSPPPPSEPPSVQWCIIYWLLFFFKFTFHSDNWINDFKLHFNLFYSLSLCTLHCF